MRLCSRKFPTMERTVIFSLTPGIPTLRQQIPRTIRSIFTPAADASYNASIIPGSQREFIFATMRASRPCCACFFSLAIRCRNLSRNQYGARISSFQESGSEYPESILKTAVASSPMDSLHVKIPQSVYSFAVESL